MTPYCETFIVGDSRYGIEDHEDGKKNHFFPHLPHKRFKCWINGSGLPDFDTLKEARNFLHKYILKGTLEKIARYNEAYKLNQEIRDRLFGSVKNIDLFKVKDSKK